MQKTFLLAVIVLFLGNQEANAQFHNKDKKERVLKQAYMPVNKDLYFGKYEVSFNEFYTFQNALKNSDRKDLYEKCKLDSFFIDSLYKETHYYEMRENSIDNFPATHVSYEAAIEFCKWTTDEYNKNPKRKFNKVIFRLPTEKEWEFAAKGGRTLCPYPWGGPYMRASDGRFLCNFNRIGPEHITIDTITGKYIVLTGDQNLDYFGLNDRAIFTCKINQYEPNDFGLYNMSGNVAEMIAEKGWAKGGGYKDPGFDVRVVSKKRYSAPSDDLGFRVVMEVIEATKKVEKKLSNTPSLFTISNHQTRCSTLHQ